MRRSEQTLNKRIAAWFALLLIALVGFWTGYVVHLLRLPRIRTEPVAAPLLLTQFVDVGSGDAAIATSPAGLSLLIDTGPDANAARAILAQLQRIRKQAPKAILLTSANPRSFGGAAYLVSHCPFHGIIILPMLPAQFARFGGAPARDLLAAAARRNLRIVFWQQLEASQTEPSVLSDSNVVATPIPVAKSRKDAEALAVRLDLKGSAETGSMLYAAGLDGEEEDRLISQRARLSCDLLAATNGGRAGSLSSEFLAETEPDDVCVSTSIGAPPDPSVLERLKAADATIRRTDLLGTVTIGMTGRLGAQSVYYGANSVLPTSTAGADHAHTTSDKPS